MRKNKALFLFFILFYFCTCVLDLLLTYYATPNLQLEGNPLVLRLEFGWFDLILINFVTFFFYFLMCRYAFLRYRPVLSSETESLRRYLADITYGDPEKANMGMWKWPKNWAPQIACLCWSVAVVLPFARLFVVLEWALIIAKIPAKASFASLRFSLTAGLIFSWRFCSLGDLVSFGLLFPFDKIKANISDCATIVKWLTKRRRRFAVFFCFFPKIRNFYFFY